MINDVLNELHGIKSFTKLELCSRYHQIQMQLYIPRTILCTYEGHYEVLVKSFGLCNAPSTFKSLINKIFGSFLCNFLLVFFDYILIYKQMCHSHIENVNSALQLQWDHQLFLKCPECTFGATKFKYVGHIISEYRAIVGPRKLRLCKIDDVQRFQRACLVSQDLWNAIGTL